MIRNKTILHSLGHAVLVAMYVALVVSVLFNGQYLFGPEDNIFMPMAALLLFVLSASIVGTLVLGRPILMYLEGQKSEAIRFFGLTIFWLFVLTVVLFGILFLIK